MATSAGSATMTNVRAPRTSRPYPAAAPSRVPAPPPVAARGHPPPRPRPPLQEPGVLTVEAADGQLHGLPPVGVGVQRTDLGLGGGAGRGVRLGGGQDGGPLRGEPGRLEILG